MKRRGLLSLLCGASLWSLAARAQQAMPVVGFLHKGAFAATRPHVRAFWAGMEQGGFAELRNVGAEYRWADGHDELLPSLAMELVRQDVAVIIVGGGDNAVTAAKRATETIATVFVSGSDPVRSGIVASLSHPGGNITGVTLASTELLAKRLEILHELAPELDVTALVNPRNPNIGVQLQYLTEAAKRIGIPVQIVNAVGETDFGPALEQVGQGQHAALLVANDGFLNGQRDRLVALTARLAIPAAFGIRDFVEAGGLVSYGPSLVEAYRQVGTYVGRILKGEKPGDLPVQHPVEFELAINLKTANLLGLKIPPSLLAAADEVIE
ncbi:MAG: ABC transporter substrate-binding protein [Xanthobacteraceae bacterium]|jgi:putative ABC transport system substrate-binding protein